MISRSPNVPIPFIAFAAAAALALVLVSCSDTTPPPQDTTTTTTTQPQPQPEPAAPAPPPAADAGPLDPVNIPPGTTPDVLATTYFDLMQNNRWDVVGNLFHPESLAEIRSGMDFLQAENTPAAANRFRAMAFGPDTAAASVAALPDEEFFAKTFNVLMKGASLGSRTMEVVGTIPEGDDVAHVVTRATVPAGEESFELLEVLSFKKDGENWKVLMPGKMGNNVRKWRTQILSSGN